ncbi:MAG: hypothetical protein WA790_20525 [Sulfitobacter sp.]
MNHKSNPMGIPRFRFQARRFNLQNYLEAYSLLPSESHPPVPERLFALRKSVNMDADMLASVDRAIANSRDIANPTEEAIKPLSELVDLRARLEAGMSFDLAIARILSFGKKD